MYQLKALTPLCSNCFKRSIYSNARLLSSHSKENPVSCDDLDTPIKYSSSPASKYKAKTTRIGVEDSRLWYEPYVILGSITMFLVYFCILREENDIDKELDRSLYSRIEGLEEVQLRLSLKYNLDNGLDTKAIVERLQEIEEEKLKAKGEGVS